VEVIVGAANLVARASDVATRAGNVFEQLFLDADIDPRVAVLRAEHNMQQDVGQGLGHVENSISDAYIPPFQGFM
jgi:hypothetical protein